MKGRKPKDEALKAASGNPGHRKHRTRVVAETPAAKPGDEFAPPQHLPAAARRIWAREAWRLQELTFLRASDLATFGQYCRAQAIAEQCDRVIASKGLTYETTSKHGSMLRRRPEVDIGAMHQRLAIKCLEQMALTTMSRLRGRHISGQLDLFTPPAAASDKPADPKPPASSTDDGALGYLN